jgi:hypothetical protein
LFSPVKSTRKLAKENIEIRKLASRTQQASIFYSKNQFEDLRKKSTLILRFDFSIHQRILSLSDWLIFGAILTPSWISPPFWIIIIKRIIFNRTNCKTVQNGPKFFHPCKVFFFWKEFLHKKILLKFREYFLKCSHVRNCNLCFDFNQTAYLFLKILIHRLKYLKNKTFFLELLYVDITTCGYREHCQRFSCVYYNWNNILLWGALTQK